jgi:hypothetical protein
MDCGVSVARPWITSSRGQQCGDQGSEELNTEADRVSQSRRMGTPVLTTEHPYNQRTGTPFLTTDHPYNQRTGTPFRPNDGSPA